MRLTISLFLILLTFTNAKANPPRTVEKLQSPAGHTFYYHPNFNSNQVAIKVSWPTQWPTTEGLNPSIPILGRDLMLSSGADGMTPAELTEAFADLKAQAWIHSDIQFMHGTLIAHKNQLTEATTLANKVLAKPTLDPRWLKRIKRTQISQQNQIAEQLSILGSETLITALFAGAPIKHYLSPLQQNAISTAEMEDIKQWHQQTFGSTGTINVIAGPVSPKIAGRTIDNLLHGLPKLAPATAKNLFATTHPRTILLHQPNAEKSALGYIGKLPSDTTDKRLIDNIATSLLGSSPNNQLKQAIREQLGSTYDFSAIKLNYTDNISLLLMTGEVDTQALFKTHQKVLNAYDTYHQGNTGNGFEELKRNTRDTIHKSLQNPAMAAEFILKLIIQGDSPNRINTLPEEISTLQLTDIQERVRTAFPTPETLITIAISPDAQALPGACVIKAPKEVVNCR